MSQFSDGDIVVQTKIKDKPNENIFQNENVEIMTTTSLSLMSAQIWQFKQEQQDYLFYATDAILCICIHLL